MVRGWGTWNLAARSRSYTETDATPPKLLFRFGDATSYLFAHGPVPIPEQPAFVVTGDEATLAAPGLRLACRGLTCYPEDELWAGSATARAAGEDPRDVAPELSSRGSTGADLLGVLQHLVMLQLRMMRHAPLLRRWELAAAATLFGGLNAELFRIRPAALRARWAARRTQKLLATEDPLHRAFLRHVGRPVPLEMPGAAAWPAPVRITVGSATRLLNEINFAGARLRYAGTWADETVIHLDVQRGGNWTPRAAAGSWYVD